MYSGYGVLSNMLNTSKYLTKMEISENFRRMCEDVVLTGIVRELANIKIVNIPGFIEAYHQVKL